jgi:hypothetical protein
MEWLLGLSLRNQALEGAAALAGCPFPAFRRPIRAQLGALDGRASGPDSSNPAPERPAGRAGASPAV